MAVTERRRAGWGRVEVGELAPPERIEPTPIQRDTFVQAPPPEINKNLERLSESLGYFNRNLMALGAKMKADNDEAETNRRLAEWNTYVSSTGNDQILQDIRTGRRHMLDDPYIAKAVRQDYAQRSADELARQIDIDVAEGKIKLGDPSFNVEQYVLQKAAPYAREMASNKDLAVNFRRGLDSIRGAVIGKHQQVMGQAAEAAFEDIAARRIGDIIDQGLDPHVQMSAEDIGQAIRASYQELGPRLKGGSLDLSYRRLDDILLGQLKHRAKDPRQAAMVMQLLAMERIDSGTGARLGSLAASNRHRDQIISIRDTAINSLASAAEEEVRFRVLQNDIAALKRNDGSFSMTQDFVETNPLNAKTVKISASERRDNAVRVWLKELRASRGGEPDFVTEFEVLHKNGIKHPEWFDFLQSTFAGAANVSINKDGTMAPDQISRIVEAAALYNNISDGGRAGLDQHLSAAARQYFDEYTVLTRYAQMSPETAARMLAQAYSSKDTNRDPDVDRLKRQTIEEKARNLDYSWLPFSGGVSNRSYAENIIKSIANTVAKVNQISADDAVKFAANLVQKNGIYVNGQLIYGVPGLAQGDEKHFQPIFEKIFKENATYLKSQGVSSASDLTVLPGANGRFVVIGKNGPVNFVKMDEYGEPTSIAPPVITTRDVQQKRAEAKQEADRKAIEGTALPRKDPLNRPEPYRPRTPRRGIVPPEDRRE